jgi:hypothetical protein
LTVVHLEKDKKNPLTRIFYIYKSNKLIDTAFRNRFDTHPK